MSNRDGGHYDKNGDYWPPYYEPSFWRKVYINGVAAILGLAILAGFAGVVWWTWTRPDPERGTIQFPDENDRFPAR